MKRKTVDQEIKRLKAKAGISYYQISAIKRRSIMFAIAKLEELKAAGVVYLYEGEIDEKLTMEIAYLEAVVDESAAMLEIASQEAASYPEQKRLNLLSELNDELNDLLSLAKNGEYLSGQVKTIRQVMASYLGTF
jgi:Fe2+ transport system protein B